MLEKNKDYVEMRVSSTDCAFVQNGPAQICVDGYVYTTYMDVPDPGEFYILISKDKFEKLQAENEQLKKKLHEFDPIPDYKELLEKLYSKEDVEKLEWTLNHICGGQASVNGWMASAKFWKQKYETLSKLVGFSSVEEIEDYLVNKAECDTLHEAIFKLIDENKYACEEWCSANSSNNSWKVAAECDSPKELIEKREALKEKAKVLDKEIAQWKAITKCETPEAAETWMRAYNSSCDVIKRWRNETDCPSPSAAGALLRHYSNESKKLADDIQKWKDMTKCETPEAAATWITSYESACGRGNRLAEMVEKLKEEVVSWKNVTGYFTPEDYLAARISGAFHTPFDYTAVWQKATGCDSPEDAKKRIEALNERIDEAEADYNHLLNITGFESEGEIEDALDRCDHSTLRKALVDYEFDYEALLKCTGYKSEHDIRVLLNDSEQFVYKDMRELINSLKRKAKFTNLNWQNSTGFVTPEKCGEYIKKLEDKLSKIYNISEED